MTPNRSIVRSHSQTNLNVRRYLNASDLSMRPTYTITQNEKDSSVPPPVARSLTNPGSNMGSTYSVPISKEAIYAASLNNSTASFSVLDPRRPSAIGLDSSPVLKTSFSNAWLKDNLGPPTPTFAGEKSFSKFGDSIPKNSLSPVFAIPKKSQADLKQLQSFRMVTNNINSMPNEKIVNKLFEKLLSVRVFPDLSFKNTPTRRKWELLLSENETNADFDLRSLTSAAMSSSHPPTVPSTEAVQSVPMEGAPLSQLIPNQYSPRSSTATFESSGVDLTSNTFAAKKQKIKDGSPQWFVTRIMSNKATAKEYRKLAKKLESKSNKGWLQQFVNAQGETALSVILQKINKRSIKSNDDIEKENHICMCLKILISTDTKQLQKEADKDKDQFNEQESLSSLEKDDMLTRAKGRIFVVNSIMHSLLSPSTATRLLVTKILVYFTHFSQFNYLPCVLEGFVALQDTMGDFVKFQPWLNTFESSIDQHITMGHKNASDQNFKIYVLTTLILINIMIRKCGHRKERLVMRRELADSRLSKIFEKLKDIDDKNIQQQIEEYMDLSEDDFSDLHIDAHSELSEVFELEELEDLFSKLKDKFESGDSVLENDEPLDLDIIKGIISKLTTIKSNRNPQIVRKVLDTLDTILFHFMSESGSQDYGSDSVLTMSIHRLMDRLETDDTAKRAVMETVELKRLIKRLEEDKQALDLQISKISNNFTNKLRQEVDYAAETIDSQRQQISSLKKEVKRLTKILNALNTENEHPIDLTKSYSRNTIDVDTTVASLQSLKMYEPGSLEAVAIDVDPQIRTKPITISSSDSIASVHSFFEKNNAKVEQNIDPPAVEMEVKAQAPPPPPLPLFIAPNIGITSLSDGTRKVSSLPPLNTSILPPPPPPPPPPPLPPLLQGNALEKSAPSAPQAPPPPPPPPPLPLSLSGRSTPAPGSSGPIPPPPPFLADILNKDKDHGLSAASSIPPPPPPLPTLNSPSTLISGSVDIFSATLKKEHDLAENLRKENKELQAELAMLKPKTKLKQMHWSKIDDIDKTFWSDISNEALANKLQEQGVLDKVEKAFVAKAPVIKSRPKADASLAVKPSKIALLPRDLAQQFGINLHMFSHLSVNELFAKILSCDKDILSNVSVLEFFNSDTLNEVSDSLKRAFAPYSQDYSRPEIKPLKSADELERADQIFLQIHNMRNYWKSRSRALLLLQSYRKDFHDLEQKLDLMDEATENIRNSESLRQVLAIIRSVGNFMNDDSKKAMGFKLDVLQRLKFMKDDSNTMTFLHYVERIVRNNFPEYGSFVDELSILNRMHKIVVEQIEADCNEYTKNVSNAINSTIKGNLSFSDQFHPKDEILTILKSPLDNAKLKSSLLDSHLKRTIGNYCSLMEYFGENPADASSRNSFFAKFAGFVLEFKKVHIENVQKEEDERAYEEKKLSIERREKARRDLRSKGSIHKEAGHEKRQESEAPELTDAENNQSELDGEGQEEAEGGSEGGARNRNDDDLDDDNDDENDAKNLNEGDDVIEKLLQELKCLGSNRKKRTRSMYIKRKSISVDAIPKASHDDSDLQPTLEPVGRYEHVNSLRRRMTTRKLKTSDGINGAEELDVVMLRAQAMLSQLRSKSSSGPLSLDSGTELPIDEESHKKPEN